MSKPEREREVKDSAWLFRQCKTKITTKKDDEGRKMMSSRRNILHEAVGGSVLGVGGLPSWRAPRPIPPVRVVFQACRILGFVSRDPCRPRRIAAPFARLECDGEQLDAASGKHNSSSMWPCAMTFRVSGPWNVC